MQYLDNCVLNPLHRILEETPSHPLQVGLGDSQPSHLHMTATSQGKPNCVFGLLSTTSLGLCLELFVKFLYFGGISRSEAGHRMKLAAHTRCSGVNGRWTLLVCFRRRSGFPIKSLVSLEYHDCVGQLEAVRIG